MGSLRATSSGKGRCEHHRYREDLGRRGVLQGQWPQYGPEWCWDMLARLSLLQIVSQRLERSVVFEDDVRFEAAFPARLQRLMEELEQAQQDWDLM